MMMENDTILIEHQSKRSLGFWLKAIFSLGLWTLWWRNDYLGLTKRSIIRRTGVLTKQERAIPLTQVQDISISYGIIRRILGHGDIRIESAGTSGTEIVMKNVDNPENFRSKVFEQIDAFYTDDEPHKPKITQD